MRRGRRTREVKNYGYGDKVDRIFAWTPDFTPRDFAVLGLAALDQAGLSVAQQKAITEIVERTYPPPDERK